MDSAPLSYFYRNLSQQVLHGFSRSLAELDWLILALVLFYIQIAQIETESRAQVIFGMVGFSVVVLVFTYLGMSGRVTRLKLAFETWAMLAFITWMVWHTGQIDSPLMNLYFLAIIASALTLGGSVTLMQVIAITCTYLYMGLTMYGESISSITVLGRLMADFSPFYLAAYVTTLLSSDIQNANHLLKRFSERDVLTGLLNKGAFEDRLSIAIDNPRKASLPLCVIMIDSDNLKMVNDRFGHAAGDQLIKSVGAILQQHVRPSDVCGRYGGDEFLLLLEGIKEKDVRALSLRIRDAVANTPLSFEGESIKSSVSIGCASYPGDAMTKEELLRNADVALYQSKHSGRNRVTLFSDVSRSPSQDESIGLLAERLAHR